MVKRTLFLLMILALVAPSPTEAQSTKLLISLLQRDLDLPDGTQVKNFPEYVARNVAYIDTLPFDGISIHCPSGYALMDGQLHSEAAIASEWAPLQNVTFTRIVNNFAVVNAKRPADFFDSWYATLESFKNFAKVLKARGLKGVQFDNEEYADDALWHFGTSQTRYCPRGEGQPDCSKTLTQYYAQARIRGAEVMRAMQSVYPDIQMMVLFSPSNDYRGTPELVNKWTADENRLSGAFTTGLIEASTHPVIDGNETAYNYRSEAEFKAAYDWLKIGMAQAPVPFIPQSLRPQWPSKVSVSAGIFNNDVWYANGEKRVMTPSILLEMLKKSLSVGTDRYTWLYWERNTWEGRKVGHNWYIPGGIDSVWFETVKSAYQYKLTLDPTIKPAPPKILLPGKTKTTP